MSLVGAKERSTQARVVRLFEQNLGYKNLGFGSQHSYGNLDKETLGAFLRRQGYSDFLSELAIEKLEKALSDHTKDFYERNKAVYSLLRYGVKLKTGKGEKEETVCLVNWNKPESNDFGVIQELTVKGSSATGFGKRPDVVLFVNGIAMVVLELKRSTVSVSEGIRQNISSQDPKFIQPFFAPVQLVMAGNDTEGLRYGTTGTIEKNYLKWPEDESASHILDGQLEQICRKDRLLTLIHDLIVFDRGIKKIGRHNQFFALEESMKYVAKRKGGIIWHTQGSGKSLTMVVLANKILETYSNTRVLVVTDQTDLDEQIKDNFLGMGQKVIQAKSGADLANLLAEPTHRVICSLIHKFAKIGQASGSDEEEGDVTGFTESLKAALPKGFKPEGDFVVFVDECHRTQSGELHKAMTEILPGAVIIGFTGTPIFKQDKKNSEEIFGGMIHTYKYGAAVKDGVVLDLRYEARKVEQMVTSQERVDKMFEIKTAGLTESARAQLKKRWVNLAEVMSSTARLKKVVADLLYDMATKDRLASERGNAILVADSISQAYRYYDLFSKTELAGKCAVITSYDPTASSINGEDSGEGQTEAMEQFEICQRMLGGKTREAYELEAKKLFVERPGRMRLLIVVAKLLTGFDAPSASYLYIDKKMQDHNLFQAICRVNRLDGEDKKFGYIVDYQDLFRSLEQSISDYTKGAFEKYDKKDVQGLLVNRVVGGVKDLKEAQEAWRALCEPVKKPRGTDEFRAYFCSEDTTKPDKLAANQARRASLYKLTAALSRAYGEVVSDLPGAGFSATQIAKTKKDVEEAEKIRQEVQLASGDIEDLKRYEPMMRHLLDNYIGASDSVKVSAFDDLSLLELIMAKGVEALPAEMAKNQKAVAETIENNAFKLFVNKQVTDPRYFQRMSAALVALINKHKKQEIEYEAYLKAIIQMAKDVQTGQGSIAYPVGIDTLAQRALFNNLELATPEESAQKAILLHKAILDTRQHNWTESKTKARQVEAIINDILDDEVKSAKILAIVREQAEYTQ